MKIFVVVNKKNEPVLETFSETPGQAIVKAERHFCYHWNYLSHIGYSVRDADVSISNGTYA